MSTEAAMIPRDGLLTAEAPAESPWSDGGRVTYALVLLVAAGAVAAWLAFAYWVGGLLRDAEMFLERTRAGECTCTRHRLCEACLRGLREERAA